MIDHEHALKMAKMALLIDPDNRVAAAYLDMRKQLADAIRTLAPAQSGRGEPASTLLPGLERNAKSKEQLMKRMVDAFLCWPLPSTFAPDCGISFDGSWVDARGALCSWPIGTNLFTAREAQLMVEHMFAVADTAISEVAEISRLNGEGSDHE